MAKILLVDDSERDRAALARGLIGRGYVVIQAADGREAVDMTVAESPDVVLMGLESPVADGRNAAREIRSSLGSRAVPMIALTAGAMADDCETSMRDGYDDCDTKPVDLPRLLAKIEGLFPSGASDRAAVSGDGPRLAPGSAAVLERRGTVSSGPAVTSEGALPGRALVVDDTESSRELAAHWLRAKGFVADVVSDGPRALERARRERYDVVLLDVMMPGMDGMSVLRALRESHSPTELPVIMATAKDGSRDVVEALTLGANDYVTKPLDFPVLMARVGTQVSLKRSVEQTRQLEAGLERRNRELDVANTRMREDLAAAAKVQAALLPTSGPQVDGYRFAWLFEPSADLAGDILNVFRLDDHHVGAYVLDVSGHGVAAALLSVTVSRFLSPRPDPSSMLWRRGPGRPDTASGISSLDGYDLEAPHRVAERLSGRFPFDEVTHQYFTIVYGVLDTRSHELRYASAGHPNLLLVPARGEARTLDARGYPIGVGSGEYEDERYAIAPGDRLYAHSDGVTEAMSPSGGLFGVRRTLDVLGSARDESLEDSLRLLSEAVREWTGSSERQDDQTVLAVERAIDAADTILGATDRDEPD